MACISSFFPSCISPGITYVVSIKYEKKPKTLTVTSLLLCSKLTKMFATLSILDHVRVKLKCNWQSVSYAQLPWPTFEF